MSTRTITLLPVLFAIATVAHATSYPIRNLEPNDAVLALTGRVPELNEDCRVTSQRANDPRTAGIRGTIDVRCDSEATQSKVRAALEAVDVPPATHRFHIAVLQGSRKEGASPELPPSASKALDDFKKVMAFKSFQVEAETVLQSDRDAESQLSNYAVELSLDRNAGSPDLINVRVFKLRSAILQGPGDKPFYPTFIETSFSIKKGETVVLGTSLSDQQARVVLVTALP
jgi:hypothetical protein